MEKKGMVREYVEAIVVALLLALLVRTFVVQAFRIPSGSMIPTLLIGDQILVDKVVYHFRKPKREEILVFKYPEDPSRDFIKRVVGLPGETLEIRNRKVYINGQLLEDGGYAYHEMFDNFRIPPRDDYGPVTIPANNYFVMGDNRENSQDSRFWGFLSEDKIVGRAFVIYWSRNIERWFPAEIRLSRFGHLVE
ncbi:MAG: signal peptidase I [Nitrospinae bacterium]|nr:signal peptidase I [Nitrospinota bacterium]